jgi:hypothetical protein
VRSELGVIEVVMRPFKEREFDGVWGKGIVAEIVIDRRVEGFVEKKGM